MNGSSDQISLVIFALLAVFVIWKLRSVLGTRPGNDPPRGSFTGSSPDAQSPGPQSGEVGNVVRLPGALAPAPAPSVDRWKGYANPGSTLWIGLDAVASLDPSFDPANFSKGATKAYELVIGAFAAGDLDALQNLLSPEVFESFEKEILDSQSREETKQLVIVSVEPESLRDASVSNGSAQITVRFASKLVSATRDKNGTVIHGDPEKVEDHSDDWTFARLIRSPDPNWRLIATHVAS